MMDVIENFLDADQYKELINLVAECTVKEEGKAHYNDDNAIQGFDNSAYTLTTKEFQHWWLDVLKNKNYINLCQDTCSRITFYKCKCRVR